MSDFDRIVEKVKDLFIDSLCDYDYHIQPNGYWNKCQTNLFTLVIPQVLLLLWTLPKLATQIESGEKKTLLKKVKFFFTALHVVITTLYGPEVLNPLSVTVSLLWLFVSFLCTFMEFNGLMVPRKSLLGYYFVCSIGYGYYVISIVARGIDTAHLDELKAAVFVFLTSFANATLRDIGDAVEQNEGSL